MDSSHPDTNSRCVASKRGSQRNCAPDRHLRLGQRCHDSHRSPGRDGERQDADLVRDRLQKCAGQQRMQHVGVNLDSGRHPLVGQGESRIERCGVCVVDLVVGAQQHNPALDPSLDLRLVSGPHRVHEIHERDARNRAGGTGVIDGHVAIVPGWDLPAREIELSLAELRVFTQKFFRGAQSHAAFQVRGSRPRRRRLDQFLAAHEIIRVDCQIGKSRRPESRRHHVERHREGGILLIGFRRDEGRYHRHFLRSFGKRPGQHGIETALVLLDRDFKEMVEHEDLRTPVRGAPDGIRIIRVPERFQFRKSVQGLFIDANDEEILRRHGPA